MSQALRHLCLSLCSLGSLSRYFSRSLAVSLILALAIILVFTLSLALAHSRFPIAFSLSFSRFLSQSSSRACSHTLSPSHFPPLSSSFLASPYMHNTHTLKRTLSHTERHTHTSIHLITYKNVPHTLHKHTPTHLRAALDIVCQSSLSSVAVAITQAYVSLALPRENEREHEGEGTSQSEDTSERERQRQAERDRASHRAGKSCDRECACDRETEREHAEKGVDHARMIHFTDPPSLLTRTLGEDLTNGS